MEQHQIVMNFTVPPSMEDIEALAKDCLSSLPDELLEFCESLAIEVEEFPDTAIEEELELDDPYEVLALYRKGNQIAPGVESKVANDEDLLILYRRPLLDMWCETGDDLSRLVREIMIEEIGRNFDFSEEEIEDMASRHYQGLL